VICNEELIPCLGTVPTIRTGIRAVVDPIRLSKRSCRVGGPHAGCGGLPATVVCDIECFVTMIPLLLIGFWFWS